jgi:hypothetical protein
MKQNKNNCFSVSAHTAHQTSTKATEKSKSNSPIPITHINALVLTIKTSPRRVDIKRNLKSSAPEVIHV